VGQERTAPALIWLASGNDHKKLELSRILAGVTLKSPADAGIPAFDPPETGTSFLENALLKAGALRRALEERGIFGPVLADDSGLCVDALRGRPGIYSARYTGCRGGEGGGSFSPGKDKKLESPERNRLLLEELGNNPRRTARFICAMVLLFDEHRFVCVQETLEGEIVRDLGRGEGGFGYDPVFYLPALDRTVAELGDDEKNRFSHRAKAGKAVAKILAWQS
jgi:XTP/dITP diphosphohydrolase